jgi:uncharacterized protein YhbP (UPF0306 family)
MKISSSLLDKRPDLVQVADSLADILEMNTLCTIATINQDGSPYSCTLYFAPNENLDLYVLTSPASRHGRNLAVNPNAAATIYKSDQPWGEPHCGIQLTGSCCQINDQLMETAFEIYSSRFPRMLELARSWADIIAKLESRLYMIEPSFIRIIDEPRYGSETSFTIQLA